MPTARAAGGSFPAGRSSSATSSASRCGPGSPAAAPGSTPPSRSDSAVNDKPASAADGSLRSTRQPAASAAATPARHNVDLPAPASPSTASTAGTSRAVAARAGRLCDVLAERCANGG
jgi:hypothetical protein